MNAPEKLPVDRKTFIGGSDAAAILKVSPWATPLDIYFKKRGDVPEESDDPAKLKLFRRGKRIEPHVIDDLIEDLGVKVTKRSTPEAPNRYVDPEYGFLAAEIDFEWEVTAEIAAEYNLDPALIGTIQNGEVKTVHHFAAAKFGDEGTEDVPIEYAAQAMQGLMVSGRKLCMFGVRTGLDDLTVYWIKRDEDTIKAMRPLLVAFWSNHVLAGVAPDPVNLPDVLQLFKREKPLAVEATPEVFKLVTEFDEVKEQARVAAERIEDLKFEIGKAMLGEAAIERKQKPRGGLDAPKPTDAAVQVKHVLSYGGAALLTIALESQTRIDSDAVRKKHPEVAAECSKTNKFFKFREPTKAEKLLAR